MPEKELDIIVKAEAENLEQVQNATQVVKDVGAQVDEVKTKTAAANVTLNEHAKATHAAAAEEHLITAESRESAKAMGELGAKGGELFERFTALTTAAGGLGGTLTGGLLLGLGAVVEGVDKVNETYQEQQHAAANLKQAVDATVPTYGDQAAALEDVNKRFEEFVGQNARFIDNENDAKDALAAFIRAGFDTPEAMDAMGVSLDLAGAKQEDFKTAAGQMLQMMEGQGRVAKQLGIDIKALSSDDESATAAHKDYETATKAVATAQDQLAAAQKREETAAENLKKTQDTLAASHKVTAAQADTLHQAEQRVADAQQQVSDASGKLTKAQQDVATAQDRVNGSVQLGNQVLDESRTKLDGARNSMDQQAQAQHELSHQWDTFASGTGPAVNYAWLVILSTLEGILELLNDIPSAAQAAWSALSAGPGQSQVVRGRTAQMAGGVAGESGVPVPAGGGGGGTVNSMAPSVTNIFNIQAADPASTAQAVLAGLMTGP